MGQFYAAFSAVFPVFVFLGVGYVLRLVKLVDDAFLRKLNRIIFHVFLSSVLFQNVYTAQIDSSTSRLVLFGVGVNLAAYALLFLIVPVLEKDNRRRGVIIQGMFRGNFLLLGLPVMESLYGPDGIGNTSVLIAVIVPLYNVLSVVALEVFRGGKIELRKILRGLCTNPLLIAAVLALLLRLARIQLPTLVMGTLKQLTAVATPLALIDLGGTFRFTQLKGSGIPVAVCVAGKLILYPAAVVALSVAFGFRGTDLGALLMMSAPSTAVASFAMAQQADADDVLAGQIIVGTTLFCLLTLFLWISGLQYAGLL